MADEFTHTDEQVQEAINNAKEEWRENELNPIVSERDDLLQYKPKEPTEEEQQVQQQKQDLFDEKVNLELEKNGLTNFKDVIKVNDEDELKNTVESLNQIVKQVKLDSGYVPEQHAKDDEYDKFSKEGNTQGMIGTKLSKLFK